MIIWVEQQVQVQTSHLFCSWTWHSAPLKYDLNWLFSTNTMKNLIHSFRIKYTPWHDIRGKAYACDYCVTVQWDLRSVRSVRRARTVAQCHRWGKCTPLRCSTCWGSCNPCTRQTSTGSPENIVRNCKHSISMQRTFRWICIWQFIVVKLSLNDSSSFWFSSYCFSMSSRSA